VHARDGHEPLTEDTESKGKVPTEGRKPVGGSGGKGGSHMRVYFV